MSAVTIDFCRPDEINAVMAFLRDNWSKDHVLASSHLLMDWQHWNPTENRYDIVVAREANGELAAMLGVIDTSRYDNKTKDDRTLWLTTWMVRPDIKAGALGLRLVRHLEKTVPHAMIGTVGNNAATEPLYRALGYRTGTLDRYGILNPQHNGSLVDNREHCPTSLQDTQATIRVLTDTLMSESKVHQLFDTARTPARSPEYIYQRYRAHPVYHYDLLGIEVRGDIKALAVARVCEAQGETALRIVDYVGSIEALQPTGDALAAYIIDRGHAYADFYVAGVPDNAFVDSAWTPVPHDGPLQLPNYFEPFTAGNVTIRYAVKSNLEGPFLLVKADADQDRPNIVTAALPAASPPSPAGHRRHTTSKKAANL